MRPPLRASAAGPARRRLALAGIYGEGIAQPTFFDLYGFFPGSFVGNPSLKPERSRGVEARFAIGAALCGRADRLSPASARRNRRHLRSGDLPELGGQCRRNEPAPGRRGRDSAGSSGDALRLSANYAYLDASEPAVASGRCAKLRRPRHSGSLAARRQARHAELRRVARLYRRSASTRDFDLFQRAVRLSAYWLGGARLAYGAPRVELFARVANAFDANYQDVVGYRTEGRSAYAGSALLSAASAPQGRVAQPVHRRISAAARAAGRDRRGHAPGPAIRANRPCGGRRGAIRAIAAAIERSSGSGRPVLTMGGGGSATGADRATAGDSDGRPALSGDARRCRAATCGRSRRRWATSAALRHGCARLAALRAAAARAAQGRDLAGGGGVSCRRDRLRPTGWRSPALDQRPTAERAGRPRDAADAAAAVLVRSDYRRGQMSQRQSLARPSDRARGSTARTIDTDGRAWTCVGPLMLDEVERLRRAVAMKASAGLDPGARWWPRCICSPRGRRWLMLGRPTPSWRGPCWSSSACRARCSRSAMARRSG